MKITAGLGRLEDLPRLVSAGTDEVFIGYVPFRWLDQWGNRIPLNRREVLLHDMQLSSKDDLKLLKRMCDDHGITASITVNSVCYGPEQYPLLAEILSELKDNGLENWIIADIGLILYLKDIRLDGKIHLSGDAGVFNADAVKLFSDMGISRCIFPRKVSVGEMGRIVHEVPGIEYEAFVMNEMCHFSGASCLGTHCDVLEPLCRIPYRYSGMVTPDESENSERDCAGTSGCGLCAINDLERSGVSVLKVVGRGAWIGQMERDVKLVRRAMSMSGRAEIQRELFSGECGGRCYYR